MTSRSVCHMRKQGRTTPDVWCSKLGHRLGSRVHGTRRSRLVFMTCLLENCPGYCRSVSVWICWGSPGRSSTRIQRPSCWEKRLSPSSSRTGPSRPRLGVSARTGTPCRLDCNGRASLVFHSTTSTKLWACICCCELFSSTVTRLEGLPNSQIRPTRKSASTGRPCADGRRARARSSHPSRFRPPARRSNPRAGGSRRSSGRAGCGKAPGLRHRE